MLKQIILIENIKDENETISFLINNNLCDENMFSNIKGILNYANKVECPIFIMDERSADYKTIYLGKIYDENTNEFWINEELLQKHKEYESCLNKNKESIKTVHRI